MNRRTFNHLTLTVAAGGLTAPGLTTFGAVMMQDAENRKRIFSFFLAKTCMGWK